MIKFLEVKKMEVKNEREVMEFINECVVDADDIYSDLIDVLDEYNIG